MRGVRRQRLSVACALLLAAGCSSAEPPSPIATPAPPSSSPPTTASPVDFTDLADLELEIGGRTVPLGSSGLTFQRRTSAAFDDASTPVYEGISTDIRAFLACDTGDWNIGGQALAVGVLAQGLIAGDPDLVDKGAQALDWGVRTTTVNGDGELVIERPCDGRSIASVGGGHTSTQWLESLGEAVVLLQSSDEPAAYRGNIAAYISQMEEITRRLMDEGNWRTWETTWLVDEEGRLFTHKTYLMAAALSLTARLSDDPEAPRWAARADDIARRGLDAQWRSGVNPERGGYDVLYQMYGTWLAQLYHSTLRPGPRKAEVGAMIDRSVAWLAARVDDAGHVDIGSSTRVCNDRDDRLPYEAADAVRVFLTWGMVRRDADLLDWAVHIDAGARLGNPCP